VRVSTKRVKEIDAFYRKKDAKKYADRASYIASDYSEDLAADLVEARNMLRDIWRISAPCGNSLGDATFVVSKIEKIRAIAAAYFAEASGSAGKKGG